MSRKEEGFSLPEKTFTYYILKLFPDAIESYQSIFLGAKEIDVFIPSLNFGIEYDGVYWHKNKLDDDIDKNRLCDKENIELVRIRECGLPNISHICKCFYLSDRGINLSDVIIELIEYISSKYQIENDISINISRDNKDIISWYENAKDRIISKRWNVIEYYYSAENFVKEHPSVASFIYYCIYDGSVYCNFWYHRNMYYLEISDSQKHFNIKTIEEVINKPDGCFKQMIVYFRVGHFSFENETSRLYGLKILEKLYRFSTLGRYTLRFPKKTEYIIDNLLWNMIIEQINKKENIYINRDIESDYAFYYGTSIIGLTFNNGIIIVSDAKKFLLNDDIFDDDLNYNERVIHGLSQFHNECINVYLYRSIKTKNIVFKNEAVKKAFFKFMQPFYIKQEDKIWSDKELLQEAMEYNIHTLEAVYTKKYMMNVPRKDRNIYYEKLALSEEVSEQTREMMLNDALIEKDIKKKLTIKKKHD